MQAAGDSKPDGTIGVAGEATPEDAAATARAVPAQADERTPRLAGVRSKRRAGSEQPVQRFRARVDVSAARAPGATVLLDVRSGLYHTLNEPAGRLWTVIEAGDATLATLVDVLDADHHDVPRETITRDVLHLLETFLEAGLITADPVRGDGVARGEGGSA